MRLVSTLLLWLFTTLALAGAIPAVWAQANVVGANGYAAMAQKAAADPALQSAMASELSIRAMALITERGYSNVDSSLVHEAAAEYAAGPDFPPQFAQANRVAHRWMFTDAAQRSGHEPWVIDLGLMLHSGAFQQFLSNFAVQVPDSVTVPVTAAAPEELPPGRLRPLSIWGPWVSVGATALTGVCALLTLAAARVRGKALASLGVSALLVGAGGWAAIEIGRRYINDALNDTTGNIRQIAAALIGHAEGSLHQWLDLTLAAGGVLVLVGITVGLLGVVRKR